MPSEKLVANFEFIDPKPFIPPQPISKTTMMFTLTVWQWGHLELPDPSLSS